MQSTTESKLAIASPVGTVTRSNTLKKRTSVSRRSSLKRSDSRKSLRTSAPVDVEYNSAFYTPVPTQGAPTDLLAERFQAWRALLKAHITYLREIQNSYEARAKSILKVSNVISNSSHPSNFMHEGGLGQATQILADYQSQTLIEANKAKDVTEDVIQALQALRSDLGSKIKEIRGLHGDFRNSIDKEKEGTKKAVAALEGAIHSYDHNTAHDISRNDPFIFRLGVDRMLEKQIDEENYLHRAYLNLENSGRELESIVVGEIQKAHNAMAGIFKKEADTSYDTVEQLRTGPIAMAKDREWTQFVSSDPQFVNPEWPLRKVADIDFPGKNHPATIEIRAGMLERKSKYLKSYSSGWYVLSPTHLHEFKSADGIYSQTPLMSLYLADQKLGSHSAHDSTSHKFMLKGKQSGGVHRGHSWVFRAESHYTMLAWFEAIKNLTEKTGAERNAFVRQHARSISTNSQHALSTSSDGLDEDEADKVPYSASIDSRQIEAASGETKLIRPQPGGRFPSDLAVPRQGSRARSDSTSDGEAMASSPIVPQSNDTQHIAQQSPSQLATLPTRKANDPYRLDGIATNSTIFGQPSTSSAYPETIVAPETPVLGDSAPPNTVPTVQVQQPSLLESDNSLLDGSRQATAPPLARHGTSYGTWMAPINQTSLPDISDKRQHESPSLHLPLETATKEVSATTSHDPLSETFLVPQHHTQHLELPSTLSPSIAPTSTASLGNMSWASNDDEHMPFGVTHEGMQLARQQTDMTISALHVPGEFPKSATPADGVISSVETK